MTRSVDRDLQRLVYSCILMYITLVHLCILLHTGIGCSYSEGKDGGGGDDDDELSAITRPPKLPQDDAVCSASYKGGHGLCLGRGGEIGTRYRGLRTRDIFGSLLYAAVLQYIYRPSHIISIFQFVFEFLGTSVVMEIVYV